MGEALQALGIQPKGATAIVQGFGNVGGIGARAMAAAGLRILGVSDIYGAVHNPKGLDIAALTKHADATGTVKGFPGGAAVDGAKLLEMPCDVLVPAAAANVITADNAPRISAKVIAEGANSPTTPEADAILSKRGIFVIPDILCNAGGVFVSYLEYTQETQQEQMTEDEVVARLEKRMRQKFHDVYSLAKDRKLGMREAAMYLAVKTVCEAVTARGYLP